MTTFLTGATGFLGSYIAAELLSNSKERIALLVRSRTIEEAEKRLWRSLQLHMNFQTYWDHRTQRIDIHLGDLTEPGLGLNKASQERLLESTDSVIHAAASLNRKSEESCANVNVKGSLEVALLAKKIHDLKPLRRYSLVSTVAVSGIRENETVQEDTAIRWNRPDLDPYGRTKKMSEYLSQRVLEGIPLTIFRPSAIIGDTRFPQTTQFDMLRAFAWMAKMSVLPLDPSWRMDIVPADFVGKAVVRIHKSDHPRHPIYHLSAGLASPNYREISDCLTSEFHKRRTHFSPGLCGIFMKSCDWLSNSRLKSGLVRTARLVNVFRPHLLGNTVFDNSRIVEELEERPASFVSYAPGVLRFALDHQFSYPFLPFCQPGTQKEVA
ncbi:MAG: SDR family oxidoreductase [Deltaproteobacteria bacterium]|nr:SDR family oxidoreductase [Deltaproteobacteria bacterium]